MYTPLAAYLFFSYHLIRRHEHAGRQSNHSNCLASAGQLLLNLVHDAPLLMRPLRRAGGSGAARRVPAGRRGGGVLLPVLLVAARELLLDLTHYSLLLRFLGVRAAAAHAGSGRAGVFAAWTVASGGRRLLVLAVLVAARELLLDLLLRAFLPPPAHAVVLR
jgi:hypothetical protein